ncbi:uncharacterized protein LOC107637193 [Arachis ipaensis]|uniref:uncharacterized protein LOC107637193 n=1 Tax=Arachis ipaensis TaxID=130454 RepID=UPI0007AFD3A7|nr:uncharacterized protein LOC107637193 [Arachis ipaensis]
MRFLMSSSDQLESEMKRFANWILDVENENIGSVIGDESEVEISDDLLITVTDDPLSHLVVFTYPNLLPNMSDYGYFQNRTFLHPRLRVSRRLEMKCVTGSTISYVNCFSNEISKILGYR